MNRSSLKISKRLLAAAGFARKGSFIADVGTDHAYLPIFLCENGYARGAVASDVNRGPTERAKANISAHALDDKIAVRLCDGLDGIESFSPDDIFMLGMGGELIVSLLSKADWIKKNGICLILQPMTHPEAVRSYLLDSGFAITGESLVEDDKIYQIIRAEFRGKAGEENNYPTGYNSDSFSLLFGAINLKAGGKLMERYLCHWRDILETRKKGKLMGDPLASVEYENEILEKIDGYLNERSLPSQK